MWCNCRVWLQPLSVAIVFWAHSACAEAEFRYFSDPEVDYWKKKSQTEPSTVTAKPSPVPAVSFPWKKYLDPKNDEFFREGDYLPPAPFMEIARNPSDENIANWFHYLEVKNAITHRLQERLETYSALQVRPLALKSGPLALDPDAKRFRLRLYFDSHCPHCQQMLGTLTDLSKRGFWIELRQIDSDFAIRSKIPFPVMSASRQELSQYHIEGVPLLLVGNLKRGTFFKIQGYQSTESVLQALRSETKPTSGGNL